MEASFKALERGGPLPFFGEHGRAPRKPLIIGRLQGLMHAEQTFF